MLFAALVEVCAGRFGTKENFWAMSILGKEIKKIIYERAPPGNIPASSRASTAQESVIYIYTATCIEVLTTKLDFQKYQV